MCLIMLQAKKVVDHLNVVDGSFLHIPVQLSALHQLDADLRAASRKVEIVQSELLDQDPDHVQLLQCFAALLSVLTAKLNEFEALYASCPSTLSGRHSTTSKGHVIHEIFDDLWISLHSTCSTYYSWYRPWPERDNNAYESMQDAMHSLMTFFFRSTRGQSQVWLVRRHQVTQTEQYNLSHIIFFAPITYMFIISRWSQSRMMSELEALPADFISMLCCLELEQLEDPPKKLARTATGATGGTTAESADVWIPALSLSEAFSGSLDQWLSVVGPDPNPELQPPVSSSCALPSC